MQPQKVQSILREHAYPQVAVARLVGLNPATFSLWLRGQSEIPRRTREDIEHAVHSMLEFEDEQKFPVDWRRTMEFAEVIRAKMTAMRSQRTVWDLQKVRSSVQM